MTHSIRLAQRSEKDMSELLSLWKNSFGDEEEFINGFIKDYLIPGYNVPVVDCDGGIASSLYMLEFPLFSQTHPAGRAAYLFAAATDEKYRNRGYMGELINYSLELYKNRGCSAVFLIPGGESLFDYYKRFGFMPVYRSAKPEFSGADFIPHDTNGTMLTRSELFCDEIFSRVYELYAASAIKYPLVPLKDENYFRRAAESYLCGDNCLNEEFGAYFGRIISDDKIFCYIFYKIGRNFITVDDIILEESTSVDWNYICTVIASAVAVSHNFNGKIIIAAPDFNNTNKFPRAMICPLNGEIKDICVKIAGKNTPNYINMFMNY